MMISRATAKAALEAYQEAARLRGHVYEPVDAAMALAGEMGRNRWLLLGLSWLVAAEASGKQLSAARRLAGYVPGSVGLEGVSKNGWLMLEQLNALPDGFGAVVAIQIAIACLDRGDMFHHVTPEHLVEVLCWEEQPA